ncbi:MAG: peptidylprolyl isomerase, partial [Planctomycetota bacterium]|nr:peptidylprolyl isomerase [Planctomycetota bacterium]
MGRNMSRPDGRADQTKVLTPAPILRIVLAFCLASMSGRDASAAGNCPVGFCSDSGAPSLIGSGTDYEFRIPPVTCTLPGSAAALLPGTSPEPCRREAYGSAIPTSRREVSVRIQEPPTVCGAAIPDASGAVTHGEAGTAGGGERQDIVVARVDGEPIYMSELLRELVAAHGDEALDRIVARTLVLQEARSAGVTVSGEEIDAQMALDEQRLKAELTGAFRDASGTLKGDRATLEDIVRARFNMTLDRYRNEVVRERLLVRRCVLKGVEPTEAQLREFFASYRRLYDTPAQYRASHILISPFGPDDWRKSYSMKRVKPDEAEWDGALAAARDLKARLDRGESFEDIVRGHSMDRRENVAAGGDVGWFTHPGRMDPAFSKEAARLKVGEVGGPVRTPYGYHLIKLTDFKPGRAAVYEEVADRVRRDYLENLVQLRTEGWLAASREKARIEKFRKDMWPSEGTDDPAVATVNGEAVRRSKLFDELIMGEGPDALDRLVNARLMRNAARARKIAIPELDVDLETNRDRIALEKAAPGTSFDQYVRETYGLDPAGYRRSVRERLEIRKLLLDSLRYDDGDLRAFFAINADKY